METATPLGNDVKLLRWPAESARRARYRALGVLRLLVLEGGVPAPVCADVREDWVRAPITDADLRARIATLQAKADATRLPKVDPYGILRFADRSISVSPTETDLLECLIRQFGSLVPRDTLRQCLPDRPGAVSRNALDLHIMRLRRRIRPLRLAIRTVRGRGYLLEASDGWQPRTRPLTYRTETFPPAGRDGRAGGGAGAGGVTSLPAGRRHRERHREGRPEGAGAPEGPYGELSRSWPVSSKAGEGLACG